MSDTSDQKEITSGPETGGPAPGETYLDEISQQNEEMSLEQLDEFLNRSDEQFAESLRLIEKDRNLSAVDPEVDIETQALHDEIDRWKSSSGLSRTLYGIFPFLPRLTLLQKKFQFFVYSRFVAAKVRTLNFLEVFGVRNFLDSWDLSAGKSELFWAFCRARSKLFKNSVGSESWDFWDWLLSAVVHFLSQSWF